VIRTTSQADADTKVEFSLGRDVKIDGRRRIVDLCGMTVTSARILQQTTGFETQRLLKVG